MEKATPGPTAGAKRGRRPAGSDTRAAIEAAAREQFGELGYQRTTLRGVASAAGVDPRLVLHYHGSKQGLFAATMQLPVDPDIVIERMFEEGPGTIGERLAGMLLEILADDEREQRMVGLIRAAASEPEAAAAVRRVLLERLLEPVARRVGGPDPELRASLMASQVVGVAMAREIVGLPALRSASPERLVAAIGPVFDHYLRGGTSTPVDETASA